jgi:integrase
VRTTATRDLSEARKRKHAIIADIQLELAHMKRATEGRPSKATDQLNDLVALADKLNQRTRVGLMSKDDARRRFEMHADWVEEKLTEAYALAGGDELEANAALYSEQEYVEEAEQVALRAGFEHAEAAGAFAKARRLIEGEPELEPAPTLQAKVTQWLDAARAEGMAPATMKAKVAALKLFTERMGAETNPFSIRKAHANKYLAEHIQSADDWSETTKELHLQQIKAFFGWIEKNDDHDTYKNPFKGLTVSRAKRGVRTKARLAYSPEELTRLIRSDWPSMHLPAAFLIALYSGLRIEEIYRQRVETMRSHGQLVFDVGGDFEAKNENSIRRVPVHPVIAPLVQRLASTSNDGFLLSGIPTKTTLDKRGGRPSEAFGDWKTALGFGPQLTFHSLRHNFADACVAGGLSDAQTKALTGHATEGALGGYKGAQLLGVLSDFIRKVHHGADVDDWARKLASAHPGNVKGDPARSKVPKPSLLG